METAFGLGKNIGHYITNQTKFKEWIKDLFYLSDNNIDYSNDAYKIVIDNDNTKLYNDLGVIMDIGVFAKVSEETINNSLVLAYKPKTNIDLVDYCKNNYLYTAIKANSFNGEVNSEMVFPFYIRKNIPFILIKTLS